MKNLVAVIILSVPALCAATTLGERLERATASTLAKSTVHVQVKLAKPVYMSEVMFRPVRGRDTVIRVDYKQTKCSGRLSAQKTHVYVPLSCVMQGKYRASKIALTFYDGRQVQAFGKSVEMLEDKAFIRL